MAETFVFNDDIQQLMSLLTGTSSPNKEIFLCEFMSSASDALDRIRYEFVTDPEKFQAQPNFYIRIIPDKTNSTITIEDSGVGMTKDGLINLGTLAKPGAKAFMEAWAAGGDLSSIGQFGIGFYSGYLVADKIRVVSKHRDDEQYIWESGTGGSFTMQRDTEMLYGEIKHGTKIIFYLKADQSEILEERRLKELVKRHSALVDFPIELYVEKSEEKEMTDPGEEEEENGDLVEQQWSGLRVNACEKGILDEVRNNDDDEAPDEEWGRDLEVLSIASWAATKGWVGGQSDGAVTSSRRRRLRRRRMVDKLIAGSPRSDPGSMKQRVRTLQLAELLVDPPGSSEQRMKREAITDELNSFSDWPLWEDGEDREGEARVIQDLRREVSDLRNVLDATNRAWYSARRGDVETSPQSELADVSGLPMAEVDWAAMRFDLEDEDLMATGDEREASYSDSDAYEMAQLHRLWQERGICYWREEGSDTDGSEVNDELATESAYDNEDDSPLSFFNDGGGELAFAEQFIPHAGFRCWRRAARPEQLASRLNAMD